MLTNLTNSSSFDLDNGRVGLGFRAVGFVGEACFPATTDVAWARPMLDSFTGWPLAGRIRRRLDHYLGDWREDEEPEA